MATKMKQCPLEAVGLISPIMSMPPHCERPRRSQDIQRHRRDVHFVSIDLALVINSDMVMTIGFHSGPIVTSSQDFLSHRMPTIMGTNLTFVHFLYDFRSFFLNN